MKPLTTEWVAKAEGDLATAGRELRARKNPNYDAACFHAQQCAEKYMKAALQESEVSFGKTHNLVALLELLVNVDPAWEMVRPHISALTGYAVHVRYPGESVDKPEAREAFKQAKYVRQFGRNRLGLPNDQA